MILNTIGNENTAVGTSALYSNVSGNNNTAIGRQALGKNLASNNTAVGFCALRENTTGAQNTALGASALLLNSIGNCNTALGAISLRNNTGCNYKSAIGKKALYFNKKYPPKNNLLSSLNIKDGTNNFFKLIVEFGWFGVLLYLFLIYSFISKKISLENKLFLFPFIIIQSIRGAGYFNGGFMLILLIIIFLQFNIQNKLKN